MNYSSILYPCIFLTGAAIIMAAYHLLLYLHYRERLILRYTLYLFAIGIYLPTDAVAKFAEEGTLKFVANRLEPVTNIMAILAYASFMMEIVAVWRHKFKMLYRVWDIIVVLSLILVGYLLSTMIPGIQVPDQTINMLVDAQRSIFLIAGIIAVIILYPLVKSDRFINWIKWGALIYLLFMALVIVTMFLTPNKRLLGLAPMHYVYLGTLADIIIFSMAMSIKMNEAFTRAAEVRSRLSKDLHDEIGATLSGVLLMGEMSKRKLDNNEQDGAKVFLDRIVGESKLMTEKMGDIVWAVNPGNDSLDKLLDRIQSFAINICKAANISFSMERPDVKPGVLVSTEARNSLYYISKEAINNAVKYSNGTQLKYSLNNIGRHFQLIIKDNGKGFDTAIVQTGNGLLNIQHRTKEAGGMVEIDSEPGKGTTITVII
jgi:signal transduction histidine kinase